jgi:hypothetical protein
MRVPSSTAERVNFYFQCRVESQTSSSYNRIVQRYILCCAKHNIQSFPLSADSLCSFMAANTDTCNADTLSNYLSAIGDFAKTNGYEYDSIRSSFKVKSVLKGIRYAHPWKKERKSPITLVHLQKIMPQLDFTDCEDRTFWAISVCAFFGLLRLGEITLKSDVRRTLLRRDVVFNDSGAILHLPASKTDRFFLGSQVQLFKLDSPLCPYAALKAVMAFSESPDVPLFSNRRGEAMSRQDYIKRLNKFFTKEENISGHSFRAGGATWLASLGFSSLDIQRCGRWTSESFKVYLRCHPVLQHTLNPHPLIRLSSHFSHIRL